MGTASQDLFSAASGAIWDLLNRCRADAAGVLVHVHAKAAGGLGLVGEVDGRALRQLLALLRRHEFVEELGHVMFRQLAEAHGLQVAMQADARRLKQILLNLLSNAVKFTPPGGAVHLRAGRNAEEGLWIEVKDNGVGIALEDQTAVFEEFRQVGNDVLRRSEGTGLGLHLSAKLAELLGGRLTYSTAPGGGSIFTLLLKS